MGLDIRWPIGLMFSIIGALLLIHGVATRSDAEMLERSLGMNVNLGWGLVLLVFGLLMLLSAKIAARGKKATSSQTPANRSNAKAGQQPI